MQFAIQTRPGMPPVTVVDAHTPRMLAELVTANWPTEDYLNPEVSTNRRANSRLRRPVPSVVLAVFHCDGEWLPVEPLNRRGALWPILTFKRMTEAEARVAFASARAVIFHRDELNRFLAGMSNEVDDTFANPAVRG